MTKLTYRMYHKNSMINHLKCRHCHRAIDEIHELCEMMNGELVVVARGCGDCIKILGDQYAIQRNGVNN